MSWSRVKEGQRPLDVITQQQIGEWLREQREEIREQTVSSPSLHKYLEGFMPSIDEQINPRRGERVMSSNTERSRLVGRIARDLDDGIEEWISLNSSGESKESEVRDLVGKLDVDRMINQIVDRQFSQRPERWLRVFGESPEDLTGPAVTRFDRDVVSAAWRTRKLGLGMGAERDFWNIVYDEVRQSL